VVGVIIDPHTRAYGGGPFKGILYMHGYGQHLNHGAIIWLDRIILNTFTAEICNCNLSFSSLLFVT